MPTYELVVSGRNHVRGKLEAGKKYSPWGTAANPPWGETWKEDEVQKGSANICCKGLEVNTLGLVIHAACHKYSLPCYQKCESRHR